MKGYNICSVSKIVSYKLYGDLQSLLVPINCGKDLSTNIVTKLLILTDWKGDSYDLIHVIVNWLSKMVYYKQVKININALGLAKLIIHVVVKYYKLSDSIITN